MGVSLYDYQIEAIKRMKNGCVLCGGVGSGKSRTSIAYYCTTQGASLGSTDVDKKLDNPCDLYIITTARKRDTLEWNEELFPFGLSPMTDGSNKSLYGNTVVIDSWNNVSKYSNIQGAFFIFDEQRVVGSGAWVKAFLKIAKSNNWILLSATPGDTWSDYIPVFIANGFYKNRTEFYSKHCVFSPFTKFRKIEKYIGQGILLRHRRDILVDMFFCRPTTPHHHDIWCDWDENQCRSILRDRFDYGNGRPYNGASEICYALRKAVNSDVSRANVVLDIVRDHPKVIVFYNFNYELDILRSLDYPKGTVVSEWNGQKHEPVPDGDRWVYLVQYTAGAEGWNCTTTDTMIFYSQNYSYKITAQAEGRIDRLNTPYTDLFYYHLKSRAKIDLAISRALKAKKNFEVNRWVSENG